jgi:hypothetical protein
MTNEVNFDPYFDDEDVSFLFIINKTKKTKTRFKTLSGRE